MVKNYLNHLINFLLSEENQMNIFPLRVVFLIVSGAMVAFLIFAFFKTHYFQWMYFQDTFEFLARKPFGAKKITNKWKSISSKLKTGSESEYKLAIIEADKMLSDSLKRMGHDGATLEEQLDKLTTINLPNIDNIYKAHQLRNNIVHSPDFVLTIDEAKKNLGIFEKALNDLQILS
jgi:hypothetical protein